MKIFVLLLCAGIGLSFAQQTGARYLIITHDSYENVLRPLAEWKTQKGLKAKIVKISETGPDSVSIRNYVIDAYNTWQVKPEYLLIVGNGDQVPFPLFYYQGDWSQSDNYYANVAGDFRNEIIPARIWVYDTIQAKTVVNKILHYDRDPRSGDTLWFRRGMTIVDEDEDSNPSDSVYWSDTWHLHRLMIDAGFTRVDTFSERLGHNETDFMNALNDGRSYIQYRGVGYRTWDYPFWDIDTALMENDGMTPIVISATCATTEGIGYEWMFAGSPDHPKGVVGFYGTTTALSYAAGFRSALARGTASAIFTDNYATLGKAAEAGRLKYYQEYNNTLEYNSWTCQGDPEMSVWTSVPKKITITHVPPVWAGDSLIVLVSLDGQPVESSLVCVRAKHDTALYHYGRTDGEGMIVFFDSLDYPDSVLLTATGRNLCPAIDTLSAEFIGGPRVVYFKHAIGDSAGNGNHQPNNGENIELVTWVFNQGDATAHGLTATLQETVPDAYCVLSDTVKYFGFLPALDSVSTGPDGFNIAIAPDCPDSHVIRLKITARDSAGVSWESFFEIRVFSPRPYLVMASWSVNDSLGGNNDHQLNPGERIDLPVWLRNIGDSLAQGVTACLEKAQPDNYFTLSDTMKNFGSILPGDSVGTGINGYDVQVDSQCPDQHILKLMIRIRDALDSNWTYFFNLNCGSPLLSVFNYTVNDSLKYVQPGDTTGLVVYLANDGSIPADSVNGHLLSSDSFVTIINADAPFGTIPPGGMGNNTSSPFIIHARPSTPIGYTALFRLAVSSSVRRDTFDLPVYVGRRDYLVWDPDPDHSSGFVIHQKLLTLGYIGDYRQTWRREFLNLYRSLFICLGMAPNKYVVYTSDPVVPEIEEYIAVGGKTYLEGGDAWWDDPRMGGYDFGPLFKVFKINGDQGALSGVSGVDTLFTAGMNFNYTGENGSIDRINRTGTARLILKNRANNFGCGVAADHRTIGFSIELGGLADSLPPSTKLCLVDSIMSYFGIPPTGISEEHEPQNFVQSKFGLEIYPNPSRNWIAFTINPGKGQNAKSIELKIYDISGRMVKTFSIPSSLNPTPSALIWNCTDQHGRSVPAGVYFVRLTADESDEIKKIVLLK